MPISFFTTPGGIEVVSRLFEAVLARDNLLLGSAPEVAIDPRIAGRWRGTSDGITAAVDLTTAGLLSGTFTGGRAEGCAFSGTIEEDDVLQNTRRTFGAIAAVEMSGCADASLDGPQTVVLTAAAADRLTPAILGIGFVNTADEDQFLFQLEDLSRIGPVLLGAGGFDRRMAGSWGGSVFLQDAAGLLGTTLSLNIASDGAVSGSFAERPAPAPLCQMRGALRASRPVDPARPEDLIWSGTVVLTGCALSGTARELQIEVNGGTSFLLAMRIFGDPDFDPSIAGLLFRAGG